MKKREHPPTPLKGGIIKKSQALNDILFVYLIAAVIDAALDNVFRNLQAAGMKAEDLLKLTFYHVGDMDSTKRREIIAARLKDHKPCMTLLFVAALANPSIKVEIDAMAGRAD